MSKTQNEGPKMEAGDIVKVRETGAVGFIAIPAVFSGWPNLVQFPEQIQGLVMDENLELLQKFEGNR